MFNYLFYLDYGQHYKPFFQVKKSVSEHYTVNTAKYDFASQQATLDTEENENETSLLTANAAHTRLAHQGSVA